uniref:Uncharacterized protein n=1 Tax=Salinispora arenicola (strain CNS-205) TaxID=391037 RepID=A8M0L8_SALAI
MFHPVDGKTRAHRPDASGMEPGAPTCCRPTSPAVVFALHRGAGAVTLVGDDSRRSGSAAGVVRATAHQVGWRRPR